ncbi:MULTISPECIES: hypothetical protein [Pseudomonas]|uniref:hypothetical protein n=1 Tax=Pseudomonas TaxID=286 RepID=UPI001FF4F756|nr:MULTISPECIES: hypothetical protein [Pseudomonas]
MTRYRNHKATVIAKIKPQLLVQGDSSLCWVLRLNFLAFEHASIEINGRQGQGCSQTFQRMRFVAPPLQENDFYTNPTLPWRRIA